MNIEKQAATAYKFENIPENPQNGIWYRILLPDCRSANGSEYYASIKLGTEKNLAVVFMGGGVSVSEYTAARPLTVFNLFDDEREAFYFEQLEPQTDEAIDQGICSSQKENPFNNWNMIIINYSTGDFHVGRSDFPYTKTDGKKSVLFHHGYENFHACMAAALQYVPKPEKLLILGGSAGGFGVSMLSDEIIQMFSGCSNITCCIDGSLLLGNWRQTAENVWKAPKEIYERLTGSNLTLDSLRALYGKYGNRVKYLFSSSVRDAELSRYQSWLDGDGAVLSRKAGDIYQKNLQCMSRDIQREIPEAGLFFFDSLGFPGTDPEDHLTQHCILQLPSAFEQAVEDKSAADWLWNAVNGRIEKIGLNLL